MQATRTLSQAQIRIRLLGMEIRALDREIGAEILFPTKPTWEMEWLLDVRSQKRSELVLATRLAGLDH